MRVERNFSDDTGFGILKTELNRHLAGFRRDTIIHLGLPERRASHPQSEAFWLFWETNLLPKAPLDLLKSYLYVWAPSRWLHEVLRGYEIPSGIVHLARDAIPFITAERKKDSQIFRFLWLNDWIHRKGGDLLLEAFLAAFSKRDKVELVVKPTYTNWNCKSRFPKVMDVLRGFQGSAKKKVRVIEKFMSLKDLAKLYSSCDCYVYPLRTQGASLTLLEAQLCDLPCIVTKYGGCLDYIDHKSTYIIDPISFEPVSKLDFFSAYEEDLGVQAVLDTKELADLLRYCFDHRDEVAKKGLASRHFVEQNFNWANTRNEIDKSLSDRNDTRANL